MRVAAILIGKSGPTMAGDFPPSSSVTGVRFRLAAFITDLPTAVRTGEEQVIERQGGERLRNIGTAVDYRDEVVRKPSGDD